MRQIKRMFDPRNIFNPGKIFEVGSARCADSRAAGQRGDGPGRTGELWVRGPQVMAGYWQNPEATRQILGPDGWLNSGDMARIDPQGHVYITGRLKEIIVMSTGEKIAPVDVETAIVRDSLFDQVLLLGHFDTVWPVGQLARMPLASRPSRPTRPSAANARAVPTV